MKKRTKKYLSYLAYTLLGVFFLAGGIIYSRYTREGASGVWSLKNLLSQSVPTNTGETETPISTMSKERVILRIAEIEKEILRETNDPDRDMSLRTELYTLQQKLTSFDK